jgi:hypothetical protein
MTVRQSIVDSVSLVDTHVCWQVERRGDGEPLCAAALLGPDLHPDVEGRAVAKYV